MKNNCSGNNMISIRAKSQDKESLICIIESDGKTIPTNAKCNVIQNYDNRHSRVRHTIKETDECNTLTNLSPVVYYFSDINLFENIKIGFIDNARKSKYCQLHKRLISTCLFIPCSIQNADSLINSSILKYYQLIIDKNHYMRMVLPKIFYKKLRSI